MGTRKLPFRKRACVVSRQQQCHIPVEGVAMASPDDLQFQEFEEAADLLAENPGATTKSLSTDQNHATLDMGLEEEEKEPEGESDQAELLGGPKKPASFWTFEYYQGFFDINTKQVLERIKGSIIPVPGKNFVQHHLRHNPDLYGPFWICATLVFTVAISGNLANFLKNHGDSSYHYSPQFHRVSIAGIVIYSYAWLVPLGLWGFLKWRQGVSGRVDTYSFLETVCVYGYSLFVYIPTALLCLIPIVELQWTLIVCATVLSGSVLVLTFWPNIQGDTKLVAVSTIASLVILHILLAISCKLYFFRIPANTEPGQHTTTVATMTKALTKPKN
ncbi:protein YIPF2 [Ambystoma mexicanum]|uniref:protein YIPF2 n=1 Tax=Ambystoma mexicanum TaxID=8296 RepID=UPI0037E741D7